MPIIGASFGYGLLFTMQFSTGDTRVKEPETLFIGALNPRGIA